MRAHHIVNRHGAMHAARLARAEIAHDDIRPLLVVDQHVARGVAGGACGRQVCGDVGVVREGRGGGGCCDCGELVGREGRKGVRDMEGRGGMYRSGQRRLCWGRRSSVAGERSGRCFSRWSRG